MKFRGQFILLVFAALKLNGAGPQIYLLPEQPWPCVFGGGTRPVKLVWSNSLDRLAQTDIKALLYQASSSTAVPLGGGYRRHLQILPGQTILESADLPFPAVKAPTRFLLQWVDADNDVLGHADILVYPANLLEALKPLAGHKPIGVFDLNNELKPALKSADLELEDLEPRGLNHFDGRLAIVRTRDPGQAAQEDFHNALRNLAGRGVAVVWIKAGSETEPELEPAVHTIQVGDGALTVVQTRVVSQLAVNPVSQLNLVRCSQWAAKPDLIPNVNH